MILQDSPNPPIIHVSKLIMEVHLGITGLEGEGNRHFDVYAAYYLPEPYSVDIPNPYTLVNSFSLILNEVFGTDIPLHPDRLIETPWDFAKLFEQRDETEEFMHN